MSIKYLTYLLEHIEETIVEKLLSFIYGEKILKIIYDDDLYDSYKEFFVNILISNLEPIYQYEIPTISEFFAMKDEYDEQMSFDDIDVEFLLYNDYYRIKTFLENRHFSFGDTGEETCNMLEMYKELQVNVNDTAKTLFKYLSYITRSLESFEINLKHDNFFSEFINKAILNIIENKRCYILNSTGVKYVSLEPIAYRRDDLNNITLSEYITFNNLLKQKNISPNEEINNIENIAVKDYYFKTTKKGIELCNHNFLHSESIKGYSKVYKKTNDNSKTRTLIGLQDISAFINANSNLDNARKALENKIKNRYCHICYPDDRYKNNTYKCSICTNYYKLIEKINSKFNTKNLNGRIQYCPKDKIISNFEEKRELHYENLTSIINELQTFVNKNPEKYTEDYNLLKELVTTAFDKNKKLLSKNKK